MNQPGTYEKTTTMDHLLAITKFNESVILIDIGMYDHVLVFKGIIIILQNTTLF